MTHRAGFVGRMGPPRRSLYDPSATDFFSRMTVQPDATRKTLYNNLIVSLKTENIWGELDILYIMAAHDEQAARLNLKSSSFTMNAVSAPTFTVDRGFAGDGSSSYLNTTFNPNTAGGNYALDNSSFGVWINADRAASTAVDMGHFNGSTSGSIIRSRIVGDVMQTRSSDGTNSSGVLTVSASGLTSVSRSASTEYKTYKNGANEETKTVTSVLLPSYNFFVGALNNNSTPTAFSTSQVSVAYAGGALTAAEHLTLFNILASYRTGVGL